MKLAIEESVLRQALEIVDNAAQDFLDNDLQTAARALRTALDAAEKVEPVAYFQITGEHQGYKYYEQVSRKFRNDADVFPLYTAPTPPTNTDSELRALRDAMPHMQKINRDAQALREAARAVVEWSDAYEWNDLHERIDRLRKAL